MAYPRADPEPYRPYSSDTVFKFFHSTRKEWPYKESLYDLIAASKTIAKRSFLKRVDLEGSGAVLVRNVHSTKTRQPIRYCKGWLNGHRAYFILMNGTQYVFTADGVYPEGTGRPVPQKELEPV
jgi:hypothetical protein